MDGESMKATIANCASKETSDMSLNPQEQTLQARAQPKKKGGMSFGPDGVGPTGIVETFV